MKAGARATSIAAEAKRVGKILAANFDATDITFLRGLVARAGLMLDYTRLDRDLRAANPRKLFRPSEVESIGHGVIRGR